MSGRKFHGSLTLSAVLRILVVEGAELAAAAALGEGDAACGGDPLGVEKFLEVLKGGIFGKRTAAIALDVDLVEAQLVGDATVLLLAHLGIGHLPSGIDGDIDGRLEALVCRGRCCHIRAATQPHDHRGYPRRTHRLPPRFPATVAKLPLT